MRKPIVIAMSAFACLIVGTSDKIFMNTNKAETDPVLASFERQFDREIAPAVRATRDSIDEDVLYRSMNSIHWTVDAPVTGEIEMSPEEMFSEQRLRWRRHNLPKEN